jgi:alpha-galactosidase
MAKELADGSMAIGLFNHGKAAAEVTADWESLHLTGKQSIRDLWRQKDLGVFDGKFSATVPSQGVLLLKLQKN